MLTTAPHMSSRRPLPTLHPPSLPSVPINRALSSCHARRHRQTLSPAATGRQRSKSLLKPAVVDSLFFFRWGLADGRPPREPARTALSMCVASIAHTAKSAEYLCPLCTHSCCKRLFWMATSFLSNRAACQALTCSQCGF